MHSASMQLLMFATAAIIIIIIAAQICGHMAPKLGQPVVVGEMVAGVLLGPSALGYALPEFSAFIFNTEVKKTLYVIAMSGLGLYMFLVGAEHESSGQKGRRRYLPIILSILGIVLPTAMGSAATIAIAQQFKPGNVGMDVYVLFVGVGLSVTAFPMLARFLQERNMMKTMFGATAIEAAAIDDAMAWCGLALISAMAVHGSMVVALYQTVIPAIFFAAGVFWLLPKIFRRAFDKAVASGTISDKLLGGLLITVFVCSLISDYIGIYSVFGGFIAGAALPKVPGFSKLLQDRLLQTVKCLFLPVFFAYSGLNTDVFGSFNSQTLWVFGVLLGVAVVSKALSAVTVLRAYRWSWGETVAMAGLMNARGLMILVYINIGLALGIIHTEMFSIMVMIAIMTTALAKPIYRLYFSDSREAAQRAAWRRQAPTAPASTDVGTKEGDALLPPGFGDEGAAIAKG